MVSIPENADYAEWWYIVGLFSTREKAEQFVDTHPIRRMEQHNGLMKPRTKYDRIKEIEVDRAPLVERWNRKDYFGKDTYLTKEEKAEHRRWEAKLAKRTPYDEMMTRLRAHISVSSSQAKEDAKWLRVFKANIKELVEKENEPKKAGS
jgi:hypothetical protein